MERTKSHSNIPVTVASDLLPVFIGTPFIGQGDILNDEWIDGRIALFEAVTKKSIIGLLGERVHWLVFLGRNPTTKVREYANNSLGNINNIHLIEDRFESQNIVNLAISKSEIDNFVTMVIADDDACQEITSLLLGRKQQCCWKAGTNTQA